MSTHAAAYPAAGGPPRGPRISRGELLLWIFVIFGVLASFAAALRGIEPAFVLGVVALPLIIAAGQRALLAWRTMLGVLLVVILMIPIRRYTVGGGGPVSLEPYRILIAVFLGCWVLALAADPQVRVRATGYGAPVMLLWISILASLTLNMWRFNLAHGFVIKALTFFASYFLVMAFVSSVIRPGRDVDRMLRILVVGGAIVSCFAIYESRSGVNYFNQLGKFMPFLTYEDQGLPFVRGQGIRAMASAQHPIALGAALVMLLPPALYLHKRTGRIWWLGCAAVLLAATLATGSRTGILMLVVMSISLLIWRARDVVKLLPYVLVMVIAAQAVMPSTLTTFREILRPSFVLKEQSKNEGTGSGRLADLGPALERWSSQPTFGEGFGTYITDRGPDAGPLGGQQIYDDQWLTTLIEIGAVGVFALGWLYTRAIRRLVRASRFDEGPRGWLLAGLASSILAFAVGMLTFDGFSFVQVTFLSFVFLGLGSVVLRGEPDQPVVRAKRGTPRLVVADEVSVAS